MRNYKVIVKGGRRVLKFGYFMSAVAIEKYCAEQKKEFLKHEQEFKTMEDVNAERFNEASYILVSMHKLNQKVNAVAQRQNIDDKYLKVKLQDIVFAYYNKLTDFIYYSHKDDPKHRAVNVNLIQQDQWDNYDAHFRLDCSFTQTNKKGGESELDLMIWNSLAKSFRL